MEIAFFFKSNSVLRLLKHRWCVIFKIQYVNFLQFWIEQMDISIEFELYVGEK